MLHKTLFFSVFFLLFYCSDATAKAVDVFDLALIKNEMANLDAESLVILDVDETLITQKEGIFCADKILLPPAYQVVRDSFGALNTRIVAEDLMKTWKEFWISKILTTIQYEIVDPEFPKFVHELQRKGIRVIALSRMGAGAFGIIPNLEEWRTQQLQAFGIDLSAAFPNHPCLSFNLETGKPGFKNGVLCTDKSTKGEALLAFLDAVQWKPSKILFIDDHMVNFESVENVGKLLNVPVTGYHYMAKLQFPYQFDEKVLPIQLLHLAETGEWLNLDYIKE